MPALKPTEIVGEILYLGHVPHRDALPIVAKASATLSMDFSGFADEVHAGLTRLSCNRVLSQHPRGTKIANTRQLSIMSHEELAEIAVDMGVERIAPEWMGATLVLRGIPDFSHVPPSSRLQGPDGTTLVIDMQNRPCKFPAMTMEPHVGEAAKAFRVAAKGRRGVTGWVERPGTLRLGEGLRLHIPDQRPWTGA